jgi:tripeptide aminopeptidase
MEVNRKRLQDEFIRLTAIDAESFHESAMKTWICGRLVSMGLSPDEDGTAGRIGGDTGNLFCRCSRTDRNTDKTGPADIRPADMPSAQEEPVLFCAHMDTVAPGCGKKAVVHDDGTITSDGTTVLGADDAAAVAEILEALQEILEEGLPHRNLELLFTAAEEPYTRGASCFDCSRLQAKTAFIPDATGPQGTFSLTEPTLVSFRFEITGRAAHAGFDPEQGISALKIAALAIAQLPEGRVDPDTTFNIGLLHGGTGTNVIPEKAVLEGEIRSLYHERALALYEKARDVFARETAAAQTADGLRAVLREEMTVRLTAYRVGEKDPARLRYEEACRRTGTQPHPVLNFGGSDSNVFRRNGIAALTIASAMHEVHTCRESTSVDEMVRATEIIKLLMQP